MIYSVASLSSIFFVGDVYPNVGALLSIALINSVGIIIRGGDENFYLAEYKSLHDFVKINDPVNSLLSGAELVGSANGLVCLSKYVHEFFILNPSTRKCKKLPMPPAEIACDWHEKFLCGFGYDHLSDDYKVVKIGIHSFRDLIVIVYSLKTNLWTLIDQNVPDLRKFWFAETWGRFASGTLYWPADDLEYCSIILGFDLGLQQFREVAYPITEENKKISQSLVACGGTLYIFYYNSDVDVSQMNDYKAENPWSKAFSIDRSVLRGNNLRPIVYLKSRQDVLIEADNRSLAWYHHESKAVENVRFSGIFAYNGTIDSHSYTESLFRFTDRGIGNCRSHRMKP